MANNKVRSKRKSRPQKDPKQQKARPEQYKVEDLIAALRPVWNLCDRMERETRVPRWMGRIPHTV